MYGVVDKRHHERTHYITYLVVLMADRDPGVVGDDSLVQRQNSLIPRLQPSNLKTNNNIYLDIVNLNNLSIEKASSQASFDNAADDADKNIGDLI